MSPRIFKTWLQKAYNRGLIINEDHLALQNEIETIATKLNKYINTIGKKITNEGKAKPTNDK